MHTVFHRYLWGGMVVILCGWLPPDAVSAGANAVDVLFPATDDAGEDATAKSTEATDLDAIREALEKLEARLQRIEERLGPSRRLRPSPATSVERRLEDIERRLSQIEQQVRQWRTLEQRIRRLETQR